MLAIHVRGDMIEVFKIVHNDLEAVLNLNFNTFNTTRGNKYKLQKFTCHQTSSLCFVPQVKADACRSGGGGRAS